MRLRAASSSILAPLAVCLCTGFLAAQSSTSDSQPAPQNSQASATKSSSALQTDQLTDQTPAVTFRQSVRRVIVDVMVRYKDDKPVHGLRASDFAIDEDKQRQHILSFDAYDFDKASISRGPKAAPLPSNVFVNVPTVPERGPLYLMLLDLVNTDIPHQMYGRQQILKFIRSKPEGTRFAIFVSTDKLRLIQGFTADKELLHASIDPDHPKLNVPRIFLMGANYGAGDPYRTLDRLTHIGQYLDGIPGRKNLIWIADRFPLGFTALDSDSPYLKADLKNELNALAQAQVAVFTIDLTGVGAGGPITGAVPNGGATSVDPRMGAEPNEISPVFQTMQTLGLVSTGGLVIQDIAGATGGRALVGRNDFVNELVEATEDGGNYYTLTYSPPGDDDSGTCHAIVVKVVRTKYQLSYRRNYCRVPTVSTALEEEVKADEPEHTVPLVSPLQAGDLLQGNMRPGAPMLHDLIFSAHVRNAGDVTLASADQMAELSGQAAFFRTRRRDHPAKPLAPVKIQTYAIDYRVLDPQLKAQAHNGKQPTLEFAMAAFDIDGRVLNGVVNDAMPDASQQSSENKEGLYRMRQTLMVPVSAVSIRMGVRDRLNDRMGTIEIALPLKPEPVAKAIPPHP